MGNVLRQVVTSVVGAAVLVWAYALAAGVLVLDEVHDQELYGLRAAIIGCAMVLIVFVVARTPRSAARPEREPIWPAASVGLAAWFWMIPVLAGPLELDFLLGLWIATADVFGPGPSLFQNAWVHPTIFQTLTVGLGLVAIKQARTRKHRWIVAGAILSAPVTFLTLVILAAS